MNLLRNAFRPSGRDTRVHAAIGQQCLRRADVRGRLVAADMLLACL